VTTEGYRVALSFLISATDLQRYVGRGVGRVRAAAVELRPPVPIARRLTPGASITAPVCSLVGAENARTPKVGGPRSRKRSIEMPDRLRCTTMGTRTTVRNDLRFDVPRV